jgi:hypothetical protein
VFGFSEKKILLVLSVVLAFTAYRHWSVRDISHAPGVLVPEHPSQLAVADLPPFVRDGYVISPRASFEIRARVLSRQDYFWGNEADLSPLDLALGWGLMSDQAVLDRIEISQAARWYFTQYEHPAPLADQDIIENSGNMHIIPAHNWVRKVLNDSRKGDVLTLRGLLVDVDHDSGWQWRTSLSRNDTGAGSCEIFYVEAIELEERPGF